MTLFIKKRNEDWTNEEQVILIRYLSKDLYNQEKGDLAISSSDRTYDKAGTY